MLLQPLLPTVAWRLWGKPLWERTCYEYLGVIFHCLMRGKNYRHFIRDMQKRGLVTFGRSYTAAFSSSSRRVGSCD